MSKWSPKDPEDVRDYYINFASLIGEANIVGVTVDAPDNQATPVTPYELLTVDPAETDWTGPIVRARFSGGSPTTNTTKYGIAYHVTLSDGQEYDLVKYLEVKERTA